MHDCYLCRSQKTSDALCIQCESDIVFLEIPLPAPTSTEREFQAWAKKHNVSFLSCGKKDMGKGY